MNLLILDSGHNEYVQGKQSIDKSLREWVFNNSLQYKIKKRCESHNIDTYLTNTNPEGKDEIGLTKRSDLANSYWSKQGKPKSMFISLHANAYGGDWNAARGCETYHANNASTNSKTFAKTLNDEVYATCKSIDAGFKNRGVKANNFTVIYKANMPAVLVEYGFYTNREDLEILKNRQDDLCEATVKAICKYFGVTYKAPVVEQPKPSTFANGDYTGRKARVIATTLNVRYDRGTNHQVIAQLSKGQIVDLGYCLNNWIGIHGYKGNKGFGYVSTDYLELI
ncbi:MAG: N-acetylmuramoyl-L-alanine amidase [Cetobacterium sp.]